MLYPAGEGPASVRSLRSLCDAIHRGLMRLVNSNLSIEKVRSESEITLYEIPGPEEERDQQLGGND